MSQQPKIELEQAPAQAEELLSPSPPKNVVRMVSNDVRPNKITIVHNEPTVQYCLLPCPVYHGNKNYQLRFSMNGITRIVCDCRHPELLVDPQPFSSLTSNDFKKFKGSLDPIVRRLEERENMELYDPTIPVSPFVPKDMLSFEPEQPFYGNEIFKPCPNDHVGKYIQMISVRGGSTIVVCNCRDDLIYGYAQFYSTEVMQSFMQKTVYNYSNPKRRNFVATPQTGFEVI